jgi:hypothetical protein
MKFVRNLIQIISALALFAGITLANSAYPSTSPNTRAALGALTRAQSSSGLYQNVYVTESGHQAVYHFDITSTATCPSTTNSVICPTDYAAGSGRWLSLAANSLSGLDSALSQYFYNSYDAFGDSITAGCCTTGGAPDYVDIVASNFGLTVSDHAISGATAYDQASQIYATTVAASNRQLFTYAIGTNDIFVSSGTNSLPGGTTAAAVPQFQRSVMAEIVWLSIPDGPNKIKATDLPSASGWATSSLQTWGFGRVSSTNGATTGALNFYGSVAYVGYTISAGSTGTANVLVDGVVVGSFSSTPATSTSGDMIPLSQDVARTYGPQVLRVPMGYFGLHQVQVIPTSPSGGAHLVYLDYIATNGGGFNANGPRPFLGGIIRHGIGSSYPDNLTGWWDNSVRLVTNTLRADGVWTAYVDNRASQLGKDINSALNVDLTHPNNLGHAELGKVWIEALSQREDLGIRGKGISIYPPPGSFSTITTNDSFTSATTVTTPTTGFTTTPATNEFNCYATSQPDNGECIVSAGGRSNSNTRQGLVVRSQINSGYPIECLLSASGGGTFSACWFDVDGNLHLARRPFATSGGMIIPEQRTLSGTYATTSAGAIIPNNGYLQHILSDGTVNRIPLGYSTDQGTVTLNGTVAVTVSVASVQAGDFIAFTMTGTPVSPAGSISLQSITAGTNFVVKGLSGDGNTYAWRIFHAP